MVLTMSEAVIESVKMRLKTFLGTLQSGSTLYTLIEKCVKEFFGGSVDSRLGGGGWEQSVVWIPYGTSPDDAGIITYKVIPWLRQAKKYVGDNSPYYSDFVALCSYVESHFAPPVSVQPAPPASNPSPPVVERARTDAVASLQSQVKALQEEIKELKQVQSSDKASLDSQIAALREEVASFPAMRESVERLEKTVASLQQPPAPVKRRGWFSGEQLTLLDSRGDPNPDVHLSELLHRIHELRN